MALSLIRRGVPLPLGGSPFSPSDVAGLEKDYDSFELATLFQDNLLTTPVTGEGDPVGGCVDGTASGDDILQAVAGARLTYRASVAAYNNQPAFELDGGDNLSIASFAGGAIAQPMTIFTVANVGDVATTYIMWDGVVSVFRLMIRNAPDEYRLQLGAQVVGGTTDTSVHIHTVVANGASSGMWIDGVSIASGDAGANALDGIFLGSQNTGALGMVGHIARQLIYAGVLSIANKNLIQSFLADRYGLSVTDFS